MKLFVRKDCEFCNQIEKKNIKVEVVYVDDKKYNGLIPQQVPILQFSDDTQIIDAAFINTLFDEIRRQK
jgi:glutaredoxin 2